MKIEILDKLFKGESNNIFILSLLITLFLIVFIIISYQIDPSYANKLTGIIFTNIFVGRVPALSLGYAANLSHFSVIGVNVATEMILVTLIYSIFVLSFKGILEVKVLEDFFLMVKEKKELHKKTFDKYGRFGLFLFVFIPFWMTGPIVGSIIGYLIGMRHYTIISIVFIATIISMTLWGVFLQEIINFLMIFGTQMVWIVLFVIVSGLLFLRFRKTIFDKISQLKK